MRAPRSKDSQSSETKQANRRVHGDHSGCVAVADQDSRQELISRSGKSGQHANAGDRTTGGPNDIGGGASARAPAHGLASSEQRIAGQEQRETRTPEYVEPGAGLRVGTE